MRQGWPSVIHSIVLQCELYCSQREAFSDLESSNTCAGHSHTVKSGIMYFMLYTLFCTLHNVHFILYTLYCTLYTVHFVLYTTHCSLHTIHFFCTLCTVHCTLFTANYTICTVDCIAWRAPEACRAIQLLGGDRGERSSVIVREKWIYPLCYSDFYKVTV